MTALVHSWSSWLRRPVAALTLSAVAFASPALAAPPAADVLPVDTVGYLSIPNAKKLSERFKQTALYQMSRDPQMAPLVDQLYGSAVAEFARIEEQVGVGFDDLVNLPQGEACMAFLMPPAPSPPAICLWLDAGENSHTMHKLIERGERLMKERNSTKSEETVGDTTLHVWMNDGRSDRQLIWAEKDSVFIICNNRDAVASMIERWESGAGETLLSNQSFAAIRKRCRGAENEDPQIEWFVDPIGIAEEVFARSPSGAIGRAILPTLGLDGLRGVGGSLAFNVGNYDTVSHLHLLLDTPRAGVIEVLAMTEGDVTPEPWAPADAASYVTAHVDPQEIYRKVRKLVDSFLGDGAFAVRSERAVERLGVKLEDEIIPALKGRITMYSWIEEPIRFDSQASVVAIELANVEEGTKLVEKFAEKYAERLVVENYSGTTYWTMNRDEPEAPQDPDAPPRPRLRPSFAVIGGYLMIADRPSSIEQAVVTASDPEKSLASSLDYKLIAAKIKRQSQGHPAGLVGFERPTEGLGFLYGLANADSTRKNLAGAAANNRFLASVDQALNENPLPPFEVIKQYFAPGGSLITNEDSGFHYMSFSLRRKLDGAE